MEKQLPLFLAEMRVLANNMRRMSNALAMTLRIRHDVSMKAVASSSVRKLRKWVKKRIARYKKWPDKKPNLIFLI